MCEEEYSRATVKELLKANRSDGHGHVEGVKLNTEEDHIGGGRTVFVGG